MITCSSYSTNYDRQARKKLQAKGKLYRRISKELNNTALGRELLHMMGLSID